MKRIDQIKRASGSIFPIDPWVVKLMLDTPFFGELLRRIERVATFDIPTLAIGYNMGSDTLTMWYNPDYLRFLFNQKAKVNGVEKRVGDMYITAAIVHELYHMIFGHLNARRHNPHSIWNVATDCAINSIIDSTPEYRTDGLSPIFGSWILPGRMGTDHDGTPLSKEQIEGAKMGQIIANLPPGMISEWYFGTILQEGVKNGAIKLIKNGSRCNYDGPPPGDQPNGQEPGDQEGQNAQGGGDQPGDQDGQGGGGHQHVPGHKPGCDGKCGGHGDGDVEYIDDPTMGGQDDHSFWDTVPEDKKDYVRSKVEGLMNEAVREADKSSNGWGNIPAELRKEIKASLQRTVDWRRVVRNFVGQTMRGSKSNSMKKINKKYPYIHPGRKHSYVARLLVAIDQSGSVDDGMLCRFFGELEGLTKKISVDILPFDCSADEEDIFTWRKGQQVDPKRVRGGGTDFDAVNRVVNRTDNRGRWDGVIVLTDGEAPKPGPSTVKRAWLLAENHSLIFDPGNELVVKIGEKDKNTGSWR